jgi:DNA-directed RNA polymerase specialized sigma24 family protein
LVWEHGIEGRPYREVATRVGCSHTLARRHYRRAVCQLARFLRP